MQYLREHDELGNAPQLTYKKQDAFGTALGGCCSIFANISLAIYVIVIVLGFMSEA